MTGIRAAIPSYAGHADATARRLSDQQVRAWVGARLAALRERLPAEPANDLDALIFHCEFGDQHVIKALENDRFADAAAASAVEAQDAHVLDAAAGSERVEAAGLAAFVAGIAAAFSRRHEAIAALASTPAA